MLKIFLILCFFCSTIAHANLPQLPRPDSQKTTEDTKSGFFSRLLQRKNDDEDKTNIATPPKLISEEDKINSQEQIINHHKSRKNGFKATIEQMLKNNYNFQEVPEEYYNQYAEGDNKNLPKAQFLSRQIKNAFDYAAKNDFNNLRFYLNKYDLKIARKQSSGEDILIHATKNNAIDSVRLLLARNFPINSQDNEGKCAIYYAALNNNSKIAKALLTKGANMNLKDNAGINALDIVKKSNNTDLIQIFESNY